MKFLAQVSPDDVGVLPTEPGFQPLTQYKPSHFLTAALNFLLGAAGVASFIYLLWGGIQWITACGDKDAVEKARRKILHALIGLTIVFSAYAALFAIRTFFNVNLIQFTISPLTSSG